MCFGYLDSGGDDEVTIRRNNDAYREYEFHFDVLAGLKPPLDLSTKIFGQDVKLPFFACPTAGNRMFHNEVELFDKTTTNERMMLSSTCLCSITPFFF